MSPIQKASKEVRTAELTARVQGCTSPDELHALMDEVYGARGWDAPYDDIEKDLIFADHAPFVTARLLRSINRVTALAANVGTGPRQARLLVSRVAQGYIASPVHDGRVDAIPELLLTLARRGTLDLDDAVVRSLYGALTVGKEPYGGYSKNQLRRVDVLQDVLFAGGGRAEQSRAVLAYDIAQHEEAVAAGTFMGDEDIGYTDSGVHSLLRAPTVTPDEVLRLYAELPTVSMLKNLAFRCTEGSRIMRDRRVRALYRSLIGTEHNELAGLALARYNPDPSDFREAYTALLGVQGKTEMFWVPENNGADVSLLATLPPELISPWLSHARQDVRLRATMALGGPAVEPPPAPVATRKR